MNKIILLAVLVSVIVIIMYNYYTPHLLEYYSLLSVEEYTYLLILIPLTLFTLFKILVKHTEIEDRFYPEKMLAGTISLVLSASFYSLTLLNPQYILQLSIISLVLFVWGLLVVVLRFDRWWIPLLVLIFLFSMVPLPMDYIQSAAYELTPIVTKSAAAITGAGIVETRVYTALKVVDKDGFIRLFRVAPVCSGITSLLSILALLPLILYLAAESIDSPKRKIIYTVLAATSSAITVFAGNILRLAVIVWIARNMGYQEAIGAFHSFPSLIYVSIATIVGILFISRLSLPGLKAKLGSIVIKRVVKPRMYIPYTSILVILALFIILIHVSSSYVSQPVPTTSFTKLLSNPSIVVFNETSNALVKSIPQPIIGEALGALDVRTINVRYGDSSFTGYLELAENPGRFHGWYVCLTAQGYRIEKSWSESLHGLIINYMVILKNNRKLLLGYTIYKYPVVINNKEITMYIRVSLFASTRNIDENIRNMRSIFTEIGKGGKTTGTPLPFIMLIINTTIITSFITLIASILYRSEIWKKIKDSLLHGLIKS